MALFEDFLPSMLQDRVCPDINNQILHHHKPIMPEASTNPVTSLCTCIKAFPTSEASSHELLESQEAPQLSHCTHHNNASPTTTIPFSSPRLLLERASPKCSQLQHAVVDVENHVGPRSTRRKHQDPLSEPTTSTQRYFSTTAQRAEPRDPVDSARRRERSHTGTDPRKRARQCLLRRSRPKGASDL